MSSETLRLKLRYILWPYVRLWTLFNAGLVGLWAILVRWVSPNLELPEGEWAFLGPLLLATAVVLPVLWRSFGLIRPDKIGRSTKRDFLPLAAIITFAIAAGTLSTYVPAKLGPVCQLENLADIAHYPPARYYLVRTALLDTLHKGLATREYLLSGKNSHRAFKLAIAYPATTHLPPDTTRSVPAWVGFYYEQDTSATAPYNSYWHSYQYFIKQHTQAFNQTFWWPCCYLERWPDNYQLADLQDAARASHLPATGSEALLLRPMYTPFAERADDMLPIWVKSQLIGTAVFCLLLLVLPLSEVGKQNLLAAESSS